MLTFFVAQQIQNKNKKEQGYEQEKQKEMPRTGLEPVTFRCNKLRYVLRHRVLDGCDNPTTLTRLDVCTKQYCIYNPFANFLGAQGSHS